MGVGFFPATVLFMLKTSVIQNKVRMEAEQYLSLYLKTDVRIGFVYLALPSLVVLEDVHVKDHHQQPFVGIQSLLLSLDYFSLDFSKFSIHTVSIHEPLFRLITYRGEKQSNLDLLIEKFSSQDTTNSGGGELCLSLKKLEIGKGKLEIIDENMQDSSSEKKIDFSHLHLNDIDLRIKDIEIKNNTYRGFIEKLSLTEQRSELKIKNLICSFFLSDKTLSLPLLYLQLNESWLLASIKLNYPDFSSFSTLEDSLHTDVRFWDGELFFKELKQFASNLPNLASTLRLRGHLEGSFNDFTIHSFALFFDKENSIKIHGSVSNAQSLEKLNIKEIQIKSHLSKKFLAHLPGGFMHLSNVDSIKDEFLWLSVQGSGSLKEFDGKMDVKGFLGSAKLSLQTYSHNQELNGKLSCELDHFLPRVFSSDLPVNALTANLKVNFQNLLKKYHVEVQGNVEKINLYSREISNMSLDASISSNKISTRVDVHDPLAQAKLDAQIALDSEHANISASIASLNLSAWGLQRIDTLPTFFAGNFDLNIHGFEFEKISGKLGMHHIMYKEGARSLALNQLVLDLKRMNQVEWEVTMSSDIATASAKGKGKLSSIAIAFNNVLSDYFPTIFFVQENKDTILHQIDIDGNFMKLDSFLGFFVPDIHFSDLSFTGKFDEQDKSIRFHLKGSEGMVMGFRFHDPFISVETMDKKIFVSTSAASLGNENSYITNFYFSYVHNSNVGDFSIDWNNPEMFIGSLNGKVFFNPFQQYILVFSQSSLNVKDSLYAIQPGSTVVYDTTGIYFKNFKISTNTQAIGLDGIISESMYEPLQVTFQQVDLNQVNSFIQTLPMTLEGKANGYVLLFGLLGKNPSYEANLAMNNLKINKYLLGDLSTESFYDYEKNAVGVKINLAYTGNSGTIYPLKANGYYFLGQKQGEIDADIQLSRFNIAFVEPFLTGVLSKISGYAEGSLHLGGTLNKLSVEGDITLRRTMLRVDYLNTMYSFTHTFHINDTIIEGRDVDLYDSKGNVAKSDLIIHHKHFSDFSLDLTLKPKKFEVLNTTLKDNELFYGQGYFSGVVKITGPFDKISIDVVGNTEKGTQLNLPLYTTSTVSQNKFIVFKNLSQDTTVMNNVDLGGLNVNLDIMVTPDAEAQIIFDPKVGDIIRGSVDGRLRLMTNDKGDLAMFGNLTVVKGDYLFTLENVINKKFYIEPGGIISWSGDPYQGQLDVTARYEVKTSLYPILYVIDESELYKRKVPVYCMMHLQGNLLNPDIKLDIVLPEADETTQNLFKTVINGEEELNKQIFALLLFGSFLPKTGGITGNAIPVGATSSSLEMLSSQFSHWLSQISKDFDMDIKYRQGDQLTQSQLEVGLGTKLFNDRLSIETNLLYGGNNSTNATMSSVPLTGDVVLEYKVSKDGNFRIKAFNRSNTFDIAANSLYTQGLAIFYRKEFDRFRDIWRKKNKLQKK